MPRFRLGQSAVSTGNAGSVAWGDVTGKPATFAPTAHAHATADVIGLDTALGGKAAAAHTHATADVTGLDGALAGKAAAADVSPPFVVLADAATITVPTGGARVYNARVAALGANRTLAFTGLVDGAQGELRIVDPAGFTLAMPAGSKVLGSVTVATNTAGKALVIAWSFDGTTLRYAIGKEP